MDLKTTTDCTISNASNEVMWSYTNYRLTATRKCYHRGYEGGSIEKVPQNIVIKWAVITLNVAQFIPTKHRYFSTQARSTLQHFCHTRKNGIKTFLRGEKSGPPIRNPSRTAVTTYSFPCDRPSPKCCLQETRKIWWKVRDFPVWNSCDNSCVQSALYLCGCIAMLKDHTLQFAVCMGLYRHAEGSHLIVRCMYGVVSPCW
jgi:hypothetical protein